MGRNQSTSLERSSGNDHGAVSRNNLNFNFVDQVPDWKKIWKPVWVPVKKEAWKEVQVSCLKVR